jgi:hypothetical protein
MDNRDDLMSRIEELGQTTIEAIEHAALLAEREDGDALATLSIMTEVLEAFYAIGEALPMTLPEVPVEHEGNFSWRQEHPNRMNSVNGAFAMLVDAYKRQDADGVRSTIKNEVLPLYKHWFYTVKGSLPYHKLN